MWYLVLYVAFATWVLLDALSRKIGAAAVVWALGTLLLGPLILPVYLAKRPLKTGEVREGGTSWNVLKNFAILWTIAMVFATFRAILALGSFATTVRSDAEKAGAGLGMFLGLGMLASVWFFPTAGAALLGVFLRKNSIVERGPTGPLVGSASRASYASGFAGLLGVAAIAAIFVGVVGSGSRLGKTAAISQDATHRSAESTALTSDDAWHLTQKTNEMDGTREVLLTREAETEIQGFMGKTRPYIAIQCLQGKPEVFVNVGKTMQSDYDHYGTSGVRVKFDASGPTRQRWTESTDNVALFSPAPSKLIKELTSTDVFLFEFTPFQETPETVKFDVSGLRAQLRSVANVCGVSL